jgi:hypothetical protein
MKYTKPLSNTLCIILALIGAFIALCIVSYLIDGKVFL